MYKSVCIVTNFRVASSSFTLLKSDEYGLPYKGELFSHERPFGLGKIKPKWLLNNQGYSYAEQYRLTSTDKLIAEIRKGEPCCFKVMPTHLVEEIHLLDEIIKASDKVYYLYRRNFKAQVESWISARETGDWGRTGFIKKSKPLSIENVKETHLGYLGKDKTVVRKLNLDPNGLLVKNRIKQLIKNYTIMSDLYKRLPGELVCMEDYFSEDRYNPYNKKTIWEKELNIPDFDVESLFVDNK